MSTILKRKRHIIQAAAKGSKNARGRGSGRKKENQEVARNESTASIRKHRLWFTSETGPEKARAGFGETALSVNFDCDSIQKN